MFEETIAKLSEASRENAPASAEDYENEDGILICGRCGEPRQTDVTICGVKMRVYCACKCVMEAAEQRRAETRAVEARMQAERFRQEGFTDSAYLQMTFERDDNPDHILSKAARNYAENFTNAPEQHGIMFTGNVGTGKTFYACCIANAVIDRGYSALVTALQPLIRELRNYDTAEQALRRIRQVDLLVLDDLAKEASSTSTWPLSQLWQLVNARYAEQRPMIVTTQYDPDSLAGALAAGSSEMLPDAGALVDRLMEDGAAICFGGPNLRRAGPA